MYVPFLNNNALEIALQGLAIFKGNDDKTYIHTHSTLHSMWKHKMYTYVMVRFMSTNLLNLESPKVYTMTS